MTKAEKIKYLLTPAIGFGIGGALWGWRWFEFIEKAGEREISFFTLISGGIFLGLIGTFSLIIFLKDIKFLKKIFILLGGLLVWILIFYIWDIGFLFLLLIFPFGVAPFFLLLGIAIALFYALALKTRIWPMVWRGTGGFLIAILIGLILANVMGGSLSFALAGIILGLALGWGLYRGQKPK